MLSAGLLLLFNEHTHANNKQNYNNVTGNKCKSSF